MYNETITKYGVPVACPTEICTYATCNIGHMLMVRVCACLWCGGFSWTASARRCARARACAVVREFADGAGAVRRVSRPPTEKFMHGTPARTLCADRYSVSSIYGVLVLCFAVHYVYNYYVQKHTKKRNYFLQWCVS